MELDDDTHLCLRCGKTIIGLDCYVSHRQQQCYKPTGSPLLSDSSNKLSSSESSEELHSSLPQDICKPSADDFFLSLNLQSNLKHDNSFSNISCSSQKSISNMTESFCSRLDITTLDNDFENTFPGNKEMCSSVIADETDSLSMDGMALSNEKWDSNFKIHNGLCTAPQGTKGTISSFLAGENIILQMDPVYEANSPCSESFAYKESVNLDSSNVDNNFVYSKAENIREHFKSSSLHESRFSFRQKLNANRNLVCCEDLEKYLCILCDHEFAFRYTFLNHLLSCKKNKSHSSIWISEIFKNEFLFIQSLHFKCLLCSFYCNDSVVFLNHLESSNHCQNAASLTKPLICFPCQDECCASDEMLQHFSKNHYMSECNGHPVIITESKKSLHCCYCLSFVRSVNHFQSKEMFQSLSVDDILFFNETLPYVSSCSHGIDCILQNSHIQILNTFISLIYNFQNRYSNSLIDLNCSRNKLKKNSQLSDSDCNQNIMKRFNQSHITNEEESMLVIQNAKACDKILINTAIKKSLRKHGKSVNRKVCHLRTKKYSICKSDNLNKTALNHHLKAHALKNAKKNIFANALQNAQQKNVSISNVHLCFKCGYKSKTAQMLTRHERSHTGERPFKCKDCNYSCCLSSQLLRHKRLHSGSKPYKCPYCKYVCNSQENLRKHILKTKKHKGKKMYKCQFCDFGCNIFFDYKEHLLHSHLEHFPNGEKDISSSAVAGIYKSAI